MSAVDYPDLDGLPPELREAIRQRGSLNVLRMVTHSPNLLPAFLHFGDDVLRRNSLPADLRELAIVRVGHRYGAGYEHHHHERLAARVGVDRAALDAARTGDTAGLPDDRASVLRWTDALLDHHRLDDRQVGEALDLLSENQLADLVLTVGFYQLVCGFLSTFGVTTEGETPPF